METFKVSVLYCLLFLGFTLSLQSRVMAADVADCKVEFNTTGSPVLISIEGKSEAPCTGQVDVADLSKSKITMELNKLDTGIPLRNKHLKENYLHIDKFPVSTLTGLKAEEFDKQQKGHSSDSKFEAVLDLHGVQKPIKGTYRIKDGKNLKAKFDIEVTEFNIPRPDFMGVKVVDKIHVTVQFKIK
jgi:polyisoprenoid-binding protein YceI